MGSRPAAGPSPYRYPGLESTWQRATDFAARYSKQSLSFLHPIPFNQALPDAKVGELLSVLLVFVDRRAEIRVHARVLECRASGDQRGLLLALLPEEQSRIELINACVEGESIPYLRRAHPRLPCQILSHVEAPDSPSFDCVATNISERGAFLATSETFEVETVVEITLTPRRGELIPLRARIASVVRGGVEEGLGVEFLYRSTAEQRKVTAEVARLRVSSSPTR
jgi:hypothetical protein